jgi:hypothetical protein
VGENTTSSVLDTSITSTNYSNFAIWLSDRMTEGTNNHSDISLGDQASMVKVIVIGLKKIGSLNYEERQKYLVRLKNTFETVGLK